MRDRTVLDRRGRYIALVTDILLERVSDREVGEVVFGCEYFDLFRYGDFINESFRIDVLLTRCAATLQTTSVTSLRTTTESAVRTAAEPTLRAAAETSVPAVRTAVALTTTLRLFS
jgi:hypothetical protein